jgi:MOSC domain-containing protein YiiM
MIWPLLSLRVGTPQVFGPRGGMSAIDKRPVLSDYLDVEGFRSDQQGDPVHHGGPQKAVHHYAAEHYPVWNRELAGIDGLRNMDMGGFGENLSTLGLTEANVAIGDTFRLGGAVIQVSQPRQPCWKLSVRFNVPSMALKVQSSGRTGWYYRVLRPGLVAATDALERIERMDPDWSLQRVLRVLYCDSLNAVELRRLADLPGLTLRMRELAARRLRNATVEDWAPRLDG